MKLFLLAMAGALGVVARYGMTLVLQGWLGGRGGESLIAAWWGSDFPLGTLVINVSGAFLLSFLTTLALAGVLQPNTRLWLGTGFCGGYTTFSTFELEAQGLLERGQWSAATAYVMGNLLLGFASVLAGRALALWLLGLARPGGTA